LSSSSDDDSSSERLRRKRQAYFVAFVATVFTISQAGKKKTRSGQKRRFRRQPDRLLQEAVDDGLFSREYRMTRTAFFKLCTLLDSQLAPSSKNTRGDVINVKEKVMVALRYFSGASYLDLIRKHGISKPGIYKVILQVTKAINTNPSIGKQTNFPSSTDSCETYADVLEHWMVFSFALVVQRLFAVISITAITTGRVCVRSGQKFDYLILSHS
jgi:hypothetical protein